MKLNFRLNPLSWWALAVALAIAAAAAKNTLVELVICLVCIGFALTMKAPARQSKSLGFYVTVAGSVIVIRVLFRVLFNFSSGSSPVIWHLPLMTLQVGALGSVNFLGDLTIESFISALTDGLRLGAIMLSLALANILGGPQALLRAAPAALHNLASALVISLNLAPQLAASFARVRRARTIRGRSDRVSALRSLFVPVLEDAFERSMSLAASMNSRGFGYRASNSLTGIFWQRLLLSLSLLCASVATYFLLATDSALIGLISFALSLGCLTVAIRLTSKRVKITRLYPQKWSAMDLIVLVTAAAVAMLALIGGVQ